MNRPRHAAANAAVFAIACALLSPAGVANETRARLQVQTGPLVGTRYYEAEAAWQGLEVGHPVVLIREPSNSHDSNAISVYSAGRRLGYVPRRVNGILAWSLDRGDPLQARIRRLARGRAPRIEIEVYVE
jgi:hypothetical protein